jgi:hypothetical protein
MTLEMLRVCSVLVDCSADRPALAPIVPEGFTKASVPEMTEFHVFFVVFEILDWGLYFGVDTGRTLVKRDRLSFASISTTS